ncbi:hypothetical protein ACFYL6_15660 [Micromonospora sp. NPDC007208]|uniref:hypothetical protein n=1 Tax=Micromonospora sp. NPDC007208 TaxID=3364236 RepID=UPI0036CF91BE
MGDVRDTDEAGQHGWYAVRSVFQYGSAAPFVYEERITIWRATNFDTAIALAEAEATEYTEDIDRAYLGFAQVHHLFDEPGHGAEIYSLMRDSALPADAYLDRFFDTGDERQGSSGSSPRNSGENDTDSSRRARARCGLDPQ